MNTVSKAAMMREVRAYAAKHGCNGFDLQKEAKRIWKQLEQWHRGAPLPKIEVRTGEIKEISVGENGTRIFHSLKSRQGAAFTHEQPQRIRLAPFSNPHTLAHELVHCADRIAHPFASRNDHHGERFYRMLKHAVEKRWKVRVSFAQVTKWGYAVDWIMEEQTEHLWKTIAQPRKFSWEEEG